MRGAVICHRCRSHHVCYLFNVQDVSASARVEVQRCITRGAVLGVKLANEFVKARLVGDVLARELQYALATQRVLERLLAYCTLASHERAFPPVATSVATHDTRHTVAGSLVVLTRPHRVS